MLAIERTFNETVVLTSPTGTRLEVVFRGFQPTGFLLEFFGSGSDTRPDSQQTRVVRPLEPVHFPFEPKCWVIFSLQPKGSTRISMAIAAPRIIRILRGELEGQATKPTSSLPSSPRSTAA